MAIASEVLFESIARSYMCSCVGLKFERAFSTLSSPALLVFVTSAKRVLPPRHMLVCSTKNAFVFYLEGGLENPR